MNYSYLFQTEDINDIFFDNNTNIIAALREMNEDELLHADAEKLALALNEKFKFQFVEIDLNNWNAKTVIKTAKHNNILQPKILDKYIPKGEKWVEMAFVEYTQQILSGNSRFLGAKATKKAEDQSWDYKIIGKNLFFNIPAYDNKTNLSEESRNFVKQERDKISDIIERNLELINHDIDGYNRSLELSMIQTIETIKNEIIDRRKTNDDLSS